jgi:hypothetical protein
MAAPAAGGAGGAGGAGAGTPSALELEHVGGRKPAVLCLPQSERGYATALGACVVLADVLDPHAQTFLRGHDADVTCLDVSASGRFLASGQTRSPSAPAGDAMAVVWDLSARPPRAVYNLFGILGEVAHVKISPDEKFFAAAGADMNVFVWDLATGEQVMGKKFSSADQRGGLSFLCWGPVVTSAVSRRPAYTLALAAFDKVSVIVLEYDFRIMRYNAALLSAQMPGNGFARAYTCGAFDASGSMILCGTTTGELAVFSVLPT